MRVSATGLPVSSAASAVPTTRTAAASISASAPAETTRQPCVMFAGMVRGLTVTPAGRPRTSTFTGPANPLSRVTWTYHAVREPGPIIAFDGSHLSVKSGRAQSASR